tara:strand:+ start:9620 stop:10444 length:825 start_codon:yes stop_codon:yes gene_type:complete
MNTALITGSSSGFGRLTADTFFAKGWNVAATMRRPDISKGPPGSSRMAVLRLDVTDNSSIEAALADCISRFGTIDVLVNNAGYGLHAMFEQSSEDSIRRIFETNVFGTMNVTRAVLPHMRRQGSGRIINVTSMGGIFGVPGNAAYSATKFAIQGLTEALALEYANWGIEVKSVLPGAFSRTGFARNAENLTLEGESQLSEHSRKLREFLTRQMNQGNAQDPQVVADKIFLCATQNTPTHNPAGEDAEATIELMNLLPTHQHFLDAIRQRFLPST